jgi:hypothetical protein
MPRGRQILPKTSVLFQEREALMLRRLSAADRRALNRLLAKLMAGVADWGDRSSRRVVPAADASDAGGHPLT